MRLAALTRERAPIHLAQRYANCHRAARDKIPATYSLFVGILN